MSFIQNEHLKVPGASLAYTVRGTGPLLLLIAGGAGGGEGFHHMADALSGSFQVVTYDRRGAPGSLLDDPGADVRLETHTGDAMALLSKLTNQPAYIFGSSAGALVGLDLVLRSPGQVRALVAHEPPVEGVLPEFDLFQDEVAAALRQGGVQAALATFNPRLGLRFDEVEPGVTLPPPDPQGAAARGQALMHYTFPAVHRYRLDVARLAASPVPLTLAGGETSRGGAAYRCVQALAAQLGKDLVEFPSHHAGYITFPRAFARRLEDIILK